MKKYIFQPVGAHAGAVWLYRVHRVLYENMSRFGRKRTFWHVRLTKTQLSMRIRTVCSESPLSVWKKKNNKNKQTKKNKKKTLYLLDYPKCTQGSFWSDCENAEADLSVRWAHISEGTVSNVVAHLFSKHYDISYFIYNYTAINTSIVWLKVFFSLLTLKAPRKTASENVVCLCRLLNTLADFSNLFLHTGKQCGPWSDCS